MWDSELDFAFDFVGDNSVSSILGVVEVVGSNPAGPIVENLWFHL